MINKNKIHQKEAKNRTKNWAKFYRRENLTDKNRIQGKYYLSRQAENHGFFFNYSPNFSDSGSGSAKTSILIVYVIISMIVIFDRKLLENEAVPESPSEKE